MNDRTVARIIKRRITLAGLDPEMFGGHSLRAGFMTEAGSRGISMIEAMGLSGHKDVNTAAIYYRAGEVLRVGAGRMMDGEDARDEDAPDEQSSASVVGKNADRDQRVPVADETSTRAVAAAAMQDDQTAGDDLRRFVPDFLKD